MRVDGGEALLDERVALGARAVAREGAPRVATHHRARGHHRRGRTRRTFFRVPGFLLAAFLPRVSRFRGAFHHNRRALMHAVERAAGLLFLLGVFLVFPPGARVVGFRGGPRDSLLRVRRGFPRRLGRWAHRARASGSSALRAGRRLLGARDGRRGGLLLGRDGRGARSELELGKRREDAGKRAREETPVALLRDSSRVGPFGDSGGGVGGRGGGGGSALGLHDAGLKKRVLPDEFGKARRGVTSASRGDCSSVSDNEDASRNSNERRSRLGSTENARGRVVASGRVARGWTKHTIM